MSVMTRRTRFAFALAAAFLTVAAVVTAQGARTDSTRTDRDDRAPYRSSIQVPDTSDDDRDSVNEENENADDERDGDPEERESDSAEGARLQALARITAEQARSSALARVPGTAGQVELENEDGNLVYSVEVRTASGDRDVKVDAGTGGVLHVEQDEDR